MPLLPDVVSEAEEGGCCSTGDPQLVQNFVDSSFEPHLVQNFT